LLEPGIAAGQLKRIEKGIMSLDQMPGRFREFDKEPWRSRGLRQMPVDNFIVFYIMKTKDNTEQVSCKA
jgi:toxin ParE1/3/4